MKSKLLIPIIVIIIIAIIIVAVIMLTNKQDTTVTNTTNTGNNTGGGPIISFADCVADGNTITESYPRKCTTSDGETFIEDIGNELEKVDLITISSPRPNDTISSPATITGKARGNWFFEGEFSLYLDDVENNLIGQANAKADGDWLTEDFVNFTATLTFPEPAYGPGKLYFNKNNASDDPELDDYLVMPVDFSL